MVVPLMLLSVGAVFFGFFALDGRFGHFVEGALDPALREFEFHGNAVVVVASTVAALGGIAVAAAIYYAERPASSAVRARFGGLATVVERLYYVNEFAENVLVRGVLLGVGRAAAAIDRYVVDGIVNGIGFATRLVGDGLRRSQTGQLQAASSMYIVGLVLAVGTLFALSGGLLARVGIDPMRLVP
jgi:NADH-quinone oxidoreductase subunit L